jgi:acyl carrier protein
MDNISQRLVGCFTTLFPGLSEEDVPAASPSTVAEWDSLGSVNLLALIHEEFQIESDYVRLDELSSFSRIHEYVVSALRQRDSQPGDEGNSAGSGTEPLAPASATQPAAQALKQGRRMGVERMEIDSLVFGRDVLDIYDFDPAGDFMAFERAYREKYNPGYVCVKVPMDRVSEIQALEEAGFRLVECQLRIGINLRKPYDTSAYPYDFEQVTREEDVAEVAEIAGETFVHSRFYVDPCLDPAISGRRNREFVWQSFRSPEEAIFRLVDRQSRRTVAFRTHRYSNPGEANLLLGGVHPAYKNLGLGLVNDYFYFNALMRMGVSHVTTRISAANCSILNLEVAGLGFRVLDTWAVLRKLY